MKKPSYQIFWTVVDVDGLIETHPTLQSLFLSAVNYTAEAIVLEIDPSEERIRNVTSDIATMWLEQADADDDLPPMFEAAAGDWWQAIQDKRDDPKGEASKADHWRDLRVQ